MNDLDVCGQDPEAVAGEYLHPGYGGWEIQSIRPLDGRWTGTQGLFIEQNFLCMALW